MTFRKRWLRRFLLLCLLLAAVLSLSAGYFWHRMGALDREHATFLSCGKSVNTLLKSYAHAIVQAHSLHDPAPLLELYADDYESKERGVWHLEKGQSLGAVVLSRLQATGKDAGTLRQLGREYGDYLEGITSIDDVKCKINLIESSVPHESVVLTVKFLLDGKDRAGRLFQDRFFYRWHLRETRLPSGDSGWRIVSDELVEGERVAGDGSGFLSVEPQSIGIDYEHRRDPKLDPLDPNVKLRFGVIQHASGSGICSVDFDMDGRTDMFFAGSGSESKLYRNIRTRSDELRFADVTHEAGLGGIDQAHAAVFFDVDNDGDRDLFIARYFAPSKFFLNEGNSHFVDRSKEFGLDFVSPAMAVCCIDIDRDGLCELYICNNGDAFQKSPDVPFYATNGFGNRLYKNVDGTRFVDVTQASGTGGNGWSLAVAACDYDLDGYMDICIANDFGRKMLYHNNRDGTFTDTTKTARVLDFSGGMGLAFGDFNFDGRPDLYTSNINSNQRWFGEEITLWQYGGNLVRSQALFSDFGTLYELYGLLGDDWRELGKMIGEGNSLFYNNGDGTFRELKDSGTNRAGWSWGVALFDHDNDTDLDIFAANGWISGKLKDDL